MVLILYPSVISKTLLTMTPEGLQWLAPWTSKFNKYALAMLFTAEP